MFVRRILGPGSTAYDPQSYDDWSAADYAFIVRAVARGIAGAQTELGQRHALGNKGARQDDFEAARWWLLSSDQGDMLALTFLADFVAEGRGPFEVDEKCAFESWVSAASEGECQALFRIGRAFLLGEHGCATDTSKGLRILRSCSDMGHDGAQYMIGNILLEGLFGVQVDVSAGLSLLELSAAGGEANAAWNLGSIYESGEFGIPQDTAVAIHWYERAVELGCEEALDILKELRAAR